MLKIKTNKKNYNKHIRYLMFLYFFFIFDWNFKPLLFE